MLRPPLLPLPSTPLPPRTCGLTGPSTSPLNLLDSSLVSNVRLNSDTKSSAVDLSGDTARGL